MEGESVVRREVRYCETPSVTEVGISILKADERNRLKSIVSKAIRYGFLPHSFSTLDELREDADEKLFYSSRYNPNHVLHRLLPTQKK